MKMNRKILMNLLIISLVAIFLGIFTNEVRAEENEFIYVSDIEYVKNLSSVGWKEITLDKTPDNTALSVKVEGAAYTFNKGILPMRTQLLCMILQIIHNIDILRLM